jgi:hypothetical protein
VTKKQQRKLHKRARIAAVRATQDAWIESYGLDKPATRKQRDHRFNASQQLSVILGGLPHAAA